MKRWLLVGIVLMVFFGLIAWRVVAKRRAAAAEKERQAIAAKAPPIVSVSFAQRRDVVHTVEAVGSVEAPLQVRIVPKIGGRIDYLTLREGDQVIQGQEVARIDPTEMRAVVRQQEQTAAEAQYRLRQAREVQHPTNVSVNTQIAQQGAALQSARVSVEQTQRNNDVALLAAQANVNDAQSRIDAAQANIANIDASIRSAQANLADATVRYKRYESLYKQGFTAAQDLDDVRAGVHVATEVVEAGRSQRNAAVAALHSAEAQKEIAARQVQAAEIKGKTDLAAARAGLTQAEAALQLANANQTQKPAYESSLFAQQANVAAAQAQLANLRAQLNDMVLRAPCSGFVTARYFDPGTNVGSGQTLLTIQYSHQVYVTTAIAEQARPLLHLGQAARVTFDALPGVAFTGRLTVLNAMADPQSRQFTARVLLANPGNRISPGMFARVSLETAHARGVIVVAHEAIQKEKDGNVVFTVDSSDTVHRRSVRTGMEDDTGILIAQGVQAGERVVTLSAAPLKDGQKVKIGTSTPPLPGQPQVSAYGGGAPLPVVQASGGSMSGGPNGTGVTAAAAQANSQPTSAGVPNLVGQTGANSGLASATAGAANFLNGQNSAGASSVFSGTGASLSGSVSAPVSALPPSSAIPTPASGSALGSVGGAPTGVTPVGSNTNTNRSGGGNSTSNTGPTGASGSDGATGN